MALINIRSRTAGTRCGCSPAAALHRALRSGFASAVLQHAGGRRGTTARCSNSCGSRDDRGGNLTVLQVSFVGLDLWTILFMQHQDSFGFLKCLQTSLHASLTSLSLSPLRWCGWMALTMTLRKVFRSVIIMCRSILCSGQSLAFFALHSFLVSGVAEGTQDANG